MKTQRKKPSADVTELTEPQVRNAHLQDLVRMQTSDTCQYTGHYRCFEGQLTT